MKFSIEFVINELRKSNISIQYSELVNKHLLFTSMRILDKIEFFENNILYISTIDYTEKINEMPPIIFVSGLVKSDIQKNVVYVDLGLAGLFNFIQTIFDKNNLIESKLTNAVGDNKSLKEILNISTEFFNNPLHILDGSMHYIEYSDNMVKKDYTDAATGKVLTDISADYTDADIMNLLRKKDMLSQLSHSRKPVFIQLPEVSISYFSINYFKNNARIAVLSILETIAPLDSSQSIIVEQVASIIEPVVKKYRNYPAISSDFKNIILDLLESRRVDTEILGFYLKKLGWSLYDGYHIFKIKMGYDNVENGMSEYTLGLIKRYFPKNILISIDNLVCVMIINTNSKAFELKTIIKKIQPHCKKELVTIAISRYFKNLMKLPEHYKATNDLMVIGKKLAPEDNILFHTDYTTAHMLSICSNEIDIRVFCLPDIFNLYEYDKKNDTEFFYSLYIYLKLNKSLAAASKVLQIHRNTLVYRIEKSSKLTGLDFNDCDLIIPIISSYEILHYYQQL